MLARALMQDLSNMLCYLCAQLLLSPFHRREPDDGIMSVQYLMRR